jgi:hypothetical protein
VCEESFSMAAAKSGTRRVWSTPWPVTILVGDDAPAVDLLLVDPAGVVERLADERGLHGERHCLRDVAVRRRSTVTRPV